MPGFDADTAQTGFVAGQAGPQNQSPSILPGLLALGLGGLGGAGLLQGLTAGPQVTRQVSPFAPQLLTPFLSQLGGIGPLAQALYGQGAGLLSAVGQGQYPLGLSRLVEQAFQPQLGDLYSQAVEQGRRRGFQDAPATSPPGGAILGPGLANLQGQMAQQKLQVLASLLPQFFQPGQQVLQTAGGALGAAPSLGSQTRTPGPSMLQTLNAFAPLGLGLGMTLTNPGVQQSLGSLGSSIGSGLSGIGDFIGGLFG